MKPAPFELHTPATLDEVVALLSAHAHDGARVLAGGQSLVPAMALRLARPAHLVDINRVAELDHIRVEHGQVRVGARVRHAAFERPVVAGPLGELLAEVVRHIAHTPIRTRGTFCGSLANADPASEWCLVAVTLDAEVVLRSARGERTVPVRDFLEGAMMTARNDDELLIEARIPLPAGDLRWGFFEFSRRSGDFALGMALVTMRVADATIVEARIGIGGIESVPRRIAAAEMVLVGQPPTDVVIHAAAAAAADAVDPVLDPRYSPEYRQDLTRTVVVRAAAQAAGVAL